MSAKTKLVTTSLLILDPRLQCRESVPESIIKEYEEGWKDKVAFPPVQVFEVDGELFVTDGFCRVMAAANIGKSKIHATITKGTFSDAVRAACGANYNHGLRRTNADKRKAALIAIAQFPDETTRALAEMCGVSHAYIGGLKDGEKKIEKLIDQAAAGEVPDLETKPQAKKTKKDPGPTLIDAPGWKCSDCAFDKQTLTDGGNACGRCLLPVGQTAKPVETNENIEEPQAEANPILETFPSGTDPEPEKMPAVSVHSQSFCGDPEPEKMPAVHTAWGRFIRACEAANCTPVIQAEIVSITKKLRGLQ